MKNEHAQEMQKLSAIAQKKKHGGKKGFKEEMKRRAEVRWAKLDKTPKTIPND